jgi:hypothetical protein
MSVLETEPEDIGLAEPTPEPPAAAPPAEEWLQDRNGNDYIKAVGRRGIIKRVGEESIEDALARDQLPKDKKPRAKPKEPPKPTGKAPVDLKDVEVLLAEALKSPAVPAAMFGDEWAAEHFTLWGPALAHNLVQSAEHSPWLRRKLEAAASGEAAMAQLMLVAGLGASVAMYLAPPIVYWLNVPVPEKARLLLGVPPRITDASAAAA